MTLDHELKLRLTHAEASFLVTALWSLALRLSRMAGDAPSGSPDAHLMSLQCQMARDISSRLDQLLEDMAFIDAPLPGPPPLGTFGEPDGNGGGHV